MESSSQMLSAYVETRRGSHAKIAKLLQDRGFKLSKVKRDKTSLVYTGERDKVIAMLSELRHSFPLGYIQGWAPAAR